MGYVEVATGGSFRDRSLEAGIACARRDGLQWRTRTLNVAGKKAHARSVLVFAEESVYKSRSKGRKAALEVAKQLSRVVEAERRRRVDGARRGGVSAVRQTLPNGWRILGVGQELVEEERVAMTAGDA